MFTSKHLFATVFVPAMVLALASGPLLAQSLDDEVDRLLNNNCDELLFPDGGGQSSPLPPGEITLGDELNDICNSPGGVSGGGGSASVQASAQSIQNGVLQNRLLKARGKDRGSDTAGLFRDGFESVSLLARPADDDGSGLEGGRFDLFFSGSYGTLDRDVTSFEDGYDSSTVGGTLGFDYRFSNALVAGLVAAYNRQDGDFDGGGDFEIVSIDPSLFLSYVPRDDMFLQVVAGYSTQDSDVQRSVTFGAASGAAISEVDGNALTLSALYGFDRSMRQFTVGPRAGLNYSRTEVDAFQETGSTGLELSVTERTVRSLQGVAGVYGSGAFSAGSGVWIPQISVEYVREFEDDPSTVTATFAQQLVNPTTFRFKTNAPDASFFNLEVGVAAAFAGGIQPYINLRSMLSNTDFSSFGGTIGVRFEL